MAEVPDRAARAAALDGNRSFVVQAPAGSGKTELLIQRYLTLLLGVDEPEQIVAITFTRKAAAEMRGRVLAALRRATTGAVPPQAHEAQTHSLATRVLERSVLRDWSLLANSQRMRIDTLDALNAWLSRQLPLLSGGVAAASIEEQADDRYRQAARATVDQIGGSDTTGRALRRLLRLLDNSVPRLEGLLADLLPKRDQWLGYLIGDDEPALRASLEQGLDEIVREPLDELETQWPEATIDQLVALLQHAAAHCDDGVLRTAAAAWRPTAGVPAQTAQRLAAWRGVARLLLTDQGTWRKRITKTLGFAPQHENAKRQLLSLLKDCGDNDALRNGLAEVPALPDPHYGEQQWLDLLALRTALIRCAAELRLIFATHRCVDFVELAVAAQQALGGVDEPSELLLALDRRIQHILVDEFQDTSKTQLRLLELMTAGWQAGDGRSLFLVGDPMQSIYRFRDADMSLFLRAKRYGVGQVRCEALQLSANFRSAPAIVDWVNRVFSVAFSSRDNIGQAQAKFYPSVSQRNGGPSQGVTLHGLHSDDVDAEATRVIEILEAERLQRPDSSMAILVQSRSHLLGLHTRLHARGWPVHAVEIDALSESQAGQDLIGLARAMSHLGDRIAWLGLLRAPWCGLRWEDLEGLCGDARDETIWTLMHDTERVTRLSADGQQRLAFVRGVLDAAFATSGLQSFAAWVERCWRQLHGPDCLHGDGDSVVAEQFFKQLAQLARDGGPIEPSTIEQVFSRPRGQTGTPGQAAVEIMTIHRAKGLEFDVVVLLGLAKVARRDDGRALYWMQRSVAEQGSLVLAPLQRDDDPLTSFLRREEERREDAERARVLYVATTRAKERLHLVCRLDPHSETVASRSLLAWLWPTLAEEFTTTAQTVAAPAPRSAVFTPQLTRFADGFDQAGDAGIAFNAQEPGPEFEWAGQSAARIGTIVHRELHAMSKVGLSRYDEKMLAARRPRFERQLGVVGVDPGEIEPAARRVMDALRHVLRDPTGRWILSEHSEARSELRLTLRGEEGLRHAQLDRTFVDDRGTRWIIDYKTSAHEGGDLETFLDSEVLRYRAQLESYAAFMNEIELRETKVALYFPLLEAFREWTPAPQG